MLPVTCVIDDMALTDAVPTRLVWRGGGTNVFVTGDFCSWRPDMCRMMLEKRSGAHGVFPFHAPDYLRC